MLIYSDNLLWYLFWGNKGWSLILDNERGKKGKGCDIKGGGVRDRLLTTVCFNFHHTHHILEFVDQTLICQHFKAILSSKWFMYFYRCLKL